VVLSLLDIFVPDMEKVAGTAGIPAEPPARNTLKIKFPFASL
jgi:hypothetical protein